MRVLITGAAGFAGSHVVDMFRRTGWDVTGLDKRLGIPGVPRFFSDFSALDAHHGVDVVVSLAATADPHEAMGDPVAAYENSVRVMARTMEYAQRMRARVLHVSTNEVYGNREGPVYAPTGPYAGAKACQEIICRAYPDVDTTIVVTQSLFGERQQPNKLIPSVVRALLAGEPVMLQRNGTRWASRPFLHAWNLADALRHLAEHPNGRQRVHVGGDEMWANLSVVLNLAEALGCEATIEAVEAGDRPGHEVDVELIGCDLDGWRPTLTGGTAFHQVARWYRDNQGWL